MVHLLLPHRARTILGGGLLLGMLLVAGCGGSDAGSLPPAGAKTSPAGIIESVSTVTRSLRSADGASCAPAAEALIGKLKDAGLGYIAFHVIESDRIIAQSGELASQVGIYSDGACRWHAQTGDGQGNVIYFKETKTGTAITYETNLDPNALRRIDEAGTGS